MYRLTVLAAAVLAACTANVDVITLDDDIGNEPREVLAAPGDTIQFRDIELVVPEEVGDGVGFVAELDDGWLEVSLENRGDGVAMIHVTSEAVSLEDGTEPTTTELVNPACTDGANTIHGRKWKSTYRWQLSSAYSPTAAFEAMVIRGANNIVTSRNDCGLADSVSASHVFVGRTSGGTAISSAGGCGGRDGKNVVGLGALTSYKAYTCWYWDSTGTLIEADIKFRSAENWITTTSIPAGCTGRLHLESVATHEFGHVFGLLHPSGNHPALTMQAGGTCSASKATLGLGDVRGLRQLY
ncbi:MAG TPA: matrixin family metalloprotease [Kofleriaceae bacterium]